MFAGMNSRLLCKLSDKLQQDKINFALSCVSREKETESRCEQMPTR